MRVASVVLCLAALAADRPPSATPRRPAAATTVPLIDSALAAARVKACNAHADTVQREECHFAWNAGGYRYEYLGTLKADSSGSTFSVLDSGNAPASPAPKKARKTP